MEVNKLDKPKHILSKTVNYFVLILMTIIFSGCAGPVYFAISENKLGKTWPLKQGIQVSHIQVDSFNNEGIPYEYNVIDTAIGLFLNDTALLYNSSGIDDYWNRLERIINCQKRDELKEIYFNKSNKEFGWLKIPFEDVVIYDTLPMDFKPNEWYKISHIYSGFKEFTIYFNINNDLKIEEKKFKRSYKDYNEQDTILYNVDLENLKKEKSNQFSISLASPGIAFFTSELNDKLKNKFYGNTFNFGLTFNNFRINGFMNGGDIQLNDTIFFKEKVWNKDAELRSFFFGVSTSYIILDNKRIKIKPYIGFTTSFVDYPYQVGNEKVVQKSNTTIRPLTGINLEYRFFIKEYDKKYDCDHIIWYSDFWSLNLQTGFIPSVFKDNLGINGHNIFFTIGAAYTVGTYRNYSKIPVLKY